MIGHLLLGLFWFGNFLSRFARWLCALRERPPATDAPAPVCPASMPASEPAQPPSARTRFRHFLFRPLRRLVFRRVPRPYPWSRRFLPSVELLEPRIVMAAQFSLASIQTKETASYALVNVTLDAPSPNPISIDYATSDGTASAGVNYLATTGTLTFAAQQMTQSFQIPLIDAPQSGNLTVNLALSNPVNTTLGSQANATLTILAAAANPSPQTTSTALASSALSGEWSQPITFTATVAPPAGSTQALTGTVDFYDGSTDMGAAPLNADGQAVFTLSTLEGGDHPITAVFSGDSDFTASTSDVLDQFIDTDPASSTTDVSSTNPSSYGGAVTFSATVAPVYPATGVPTGFIDFMNGSSVMAAVSLNSSAMATFTTSSLSVGAHSITAAYMGDSHFSPSSSSTLTQNVQKDNTAIVVTSSVDPSSVGQSVTFTANVGVPSGGSNVPTGYVAFLDGTNTLATESLSGHQAVFTTSSLAAGTHNITAVYAGDANDNGSTSSVLTQTVSLMSTSTSLSSSANPSELGQVVTFAASVTGNGTPTGTVSFDTGSTTLGTVALSSGLASFSISTLAIGSHNIVAVYNGSSTFAASTSATLTQVVNADPTAGNLAYTTLHDQTLTVSAAQGLLSAATDPDGNPLTAALVAGTGPAHGTLALNANGSFTYTPNTAYTGSDSFQFTVSDAYTTSSPATVSLTVSADTQASLQALNFGAVAGEPTGLIVVATVTDPLHEAANDAAAINWGDGSSSPGAVQLETGSSDVYQILGNHTYSAAGTFNVTPSLTMVGQVLQAQGSAQVTAQWSATAQQAAVDPQQAYLLTLGEASIDLNQGAVDISQALDFNQSHGGIDGGSPALVYNGATANARPTIQVALDSTTSSVVPSQITVQLTFNNVAQAPVTFNTTGYQPGATYLLPVQLAAPLSASGVYIWQANLQLDYANQPTIYTSVSGTSQVVGNASPDGVGWGIAGIDHLVVSAAGALWVTGTGDSRLFAANGSGGFTSPATDLGTLVQNGNGTFTYTAANHVISNFSSTGLLTTVLEPTGLFWTYAYDGNQRLTQITAADGGVTAFAYDGNGMLATITEPGGRVLTLTHDSSGNLTTLVDVNGTTRTFGYNSQHQLTSDQWAPWNTTFSYSTNGLLNGVAFGSVESYAIVSVPAQTSAALQGTASVTDSLGHTTLYTLDSAGRILTATQPNGLAQTWAYDSHGQLTSYTDQDGLATGYAYVYGVYNSNLGGGNGDLIEVSNPDGSTVEYRYDPTFQTVVSTTDGDGNVTLSTIDSMGEVLTTTTAAGTPIAATTTNTWANGLLQTSTDPDGNETFYVYNSKNHLTAQHTLDANGNVVDSQSFSYDANGYQASSTVGVGGTAPLTTYSVNDARGQLLSQTDPAGDSTGTTFTAAGMIFTSTDGNGNVTQNTYNAAALVTQQIVDANTSAPETDLNSYNGAGNQTTSTDADGNVTTNVYNADNFLMQSTTRDPAGNIISSMAYTYDNDGNVLTSTDADNNVTTYGYDGDGRLAGTTVTDASGRVISSQAMTYDKDGNTLTSTDGDGNVTTSTYDKDSRLLTQTLTDVAGRVVSYQALTYDADGNVLTSTDGDGNVTTYTYNGQGNVLTQTVKDINGRLISTTSSSYNLDGENPGSTDGDSNVTTTTYDGDGRVATQTVTDPSGHVISFVGYTYDGNGNVLTSTDGDGNVTTSTYNADNLLLTQVVTDASGNVISSQTNTYDRTGNLLTSTDGDNNVTTNSYDGNQLLGSVTRDSSGRVISASGNTFDHAGNVVTSVDGDGNITTNTYDGNQLSTTVTTDPTGRVLSSMSYTYDGNGNVANQHGRRQQCHHKFLRRQHPGRDRGDRQHRPRHQRLGHHARPQRQHPHQRGRRRQHYNEHLRRQPGVHHGDDRSAG